MSWLILIASLLITGIALLLTPNITPRYERRVELSAAPDHLPRWFWLALVTFLVLGGVALYLGENWNRIPKRFPIHWGIDGQPNGWAERTPPGVFGPLILCGFVNAWLTVLSLVIWHGSRRSAYRAGVLQILLMTEFVLTLVSSLVAINPLWHFGAGVIVVVILGSVAGTVGWAIWRAGQINADPSAADDQTDPECWHAGVVYFNRKDPAIVVPRRDGLGYTLNAARRGAWLLTAGAAIMIVLFIFWMH
jgi:uncharacterized membrane protein